MPSPLPGINLFAVAAKNDRINGNIHVGRIGMNKRFQFFSGFDIPDFEHSVIADNGKRFTVGAERNGFDRAFESGQSIKFSPRSEIPISPSDRGLKMRSVFRSD